MPVIEFKQLVGGTMNDFMINDDYRLQLKRDDKHAGLNRVAVGPGMVEIYRLATKVCHGVGIDIGASVNSTDSSLGFPGSIPVDTALPGSGSATQLLQGDASMDYVFSSHCLEHLDDPEQCVREIYRVLKPAGVVFLYLPHPGSQFRWDPKMYEAARVAHKWQPTPGSVSRLLRMNDFAVQYCEYEADQLGSFAVIASK